MNKDELEVRVLEKWARHGGREGGREGEKRERPTHASSDSSGERNKRLVLLLL